MDSVHCNKARDEVIPSVLENDAYIFIISYGLLDEFARFRQGRDGDGHQEAVALLAREVENMR